jgi:hypothetical protein
VTIPSAGDYLLVLDNQTGSEARSVEVSVRGERGPATAARDAKSPAAEPDGPDAARFAETEEKLRSFSEGLNRFLIFDPIGFDVASCDEPRITANGGTIRICAEYSRVLYERLGDKAKASDAFLFALFHEVGHVLLEEWNYPFHGNEEVADEFAVALMTMLGQSERIPAAVEFFDRRPSVGEALAKTLVDDRHPLSRQRARNIERWIADPELVRRWQTVLVPHMQTALLKRIEDEKPSWADRELVDKELLARRRAR